MLEESGIDILFGDVAKQAIMNLNLIPEEKREQLAQAIDGGQDRRTGFLSSAAHGIIQLAALVALRSAARFSGSKGAALEAQIQSDAKGVYNKLSAEWLMPMTDAGTFATGLIDALDTRLNLQSEKSDRIPPQPARLQRKTTNEERSIG